VVIALKLKTNSKAEVPGVRYRIKTVKRQARLRKVGEKERSSKRIGGKKKQGKRNAAMCRTMWKRTRSWN